MAENGKIFDFRGFRTQFEAGENRGPHNPRLVFDDAAKMRYLELLSESGLLARCAAECGVPYHVVKQHRDSDPEFRDAVEFALMLYRDSVKNAVRVQAIEGVEEPIFGGRFKDKQVGTLRRFTPGLLAMEAKRVEPEYREKQQVEMEVTGSGVLAVPVAAVTVDEWLARAKAEPDGTPDDQSPE